MNFYNLPQESELRKTLADVCLAMKRGDKNVLHAGKQVTMQVSKKGTKYFTFEAGVPTRVAVFESPTGKHGVTLELSLKSTKDDGFRVVEDNVSVRGKVQVDRRGIPNVYFFGPYQDGFVQGRLQAKLELIRNRKLAPHLVFTAAEVREHAKARRLTEGEAAELIGDIDEDRTVN